MKVVGVIPARMGSSRFPGKPLARICGRSMLEHVYRRTAMCSLLDEVIVAGCDPEIEEEARRMGAQYVGTASSHQRASDRVAEVATARTDASLVVLVQGDEPMIHPDMIGLALQPLFDDATVVCTNLAGRIRTEEEFDDRNTIKVVTDRDGNALYFSRCPIPSGAAGTAAHRWKQVCVIPFQRDFLLRYAALASTPLEQQESIDMLRILEHGYAVRMVGCEAETYSVDTRDDLVRVESLMARDPLTFQY